jgi:hypothetical protein
MGAATGPVFLAVLSRWDTAPPTLCATASPAALDAVAEHTSIVITEVFDGESYLLARFPIRQKQLT